MIVHRALRIWIPGALLAVASYLLFGLTGLVIALLVSDILILVLEFRKRSRFFWWLLAANITIASAAHQRLTGPTYPLSGTTQFAGQTIDFRLDRSHGGDGDHEVRVVTPSPDITGRLEWKRHKTNDAWSAAEMRFADGALTGVLPHQPPAGKLDYRVELRVRDEVTFLPPVGGTVIRFKGDVPLSILIPHVIAMFFGMLLSTRAGLELFGSGEKLRPMIYWTLGLLGIGGLILGPIVQKYAFGAYWTGWPFGHDLTDNKTLVAFLGWVAAAVALHKGHYPGRWAMGAAVVTLIVFMIPHSVLGSELKYEEMDRDAKPAVQQIVLPDDASHGILLAGHGGQRGRGPVPAVQKRSA